MAKKKEPKINVDSLIGQLAMHLREETVRKLMRGNDARCFTTEQYTNSYESVSKDNTVWRIMCKNEPGLPRKHLTSLSHLIVEVSPDVWAYKEDAKQ